MRAVRQSTDNLAQGNKCKEVQDSQATHVAHLPPDTVLYAGSDIGPDNLCSHPTVQQAGRRCRTQVIHALQGDIAAHRTQI